MDNERHILIPQQLVEGVYNLEELVRVTEGMLNNSYPNYELVKIDLPYAICKEKTDGLF